MSRNGLIELPTVEGAVTPGRDDETYSTGSHHPSPFKHVELEICTACDVGAHPGSCFGCDRFSDVIKSPSMTVSQVEMFVKESIDLNWEWERIRVLGGEPSIHKQFREICSLVCDYRRRHPKCFIQVLSNGLGKLEEHMDWLLDRGIDPHIEGPKVKGQTPHWFANTRICEVDRHGIDCPPRPPCGIFGPRGCGIAVTYNGIFLDGAGASAAKVAGLDIGVMHLKEVTWEAMMEQAKVLCRICGHWNSVEPGAPPVTQLVSKTGSVTGAYWTEKIAAFNHGETPKLRVYGDG